MALNSLDASAGRTEAAVHAPVAFLLLDGLRRSRLADPTNAVLCAVGLTREGVASPLALRAAEAEDEPHWRALLEELRAGGVGPDLLLVCSDGHPALVKAVHAIFPKTPHQISVAHRLLALARRVDARWRSACLAEARLIFSAPDRAAAVALFREWHARWLKQGEFAVRSLEADLASCLTFYRFPAPLWNRIRTVNLVERLFREARRSPLPAPSSWDWELPAEIAGIEDAGEAAAARPAPVAEGPTGAAPVEVSTQRAEAPPPTEAPDRAFPVLLIRPVRDAEATMLYIPPEWVADGPPVKVDRTPGPAARTAAVAGAFPPREKQQRSSRRPGLRLTVALTLTSVVGLVAGIAIALGR